jgi:hypothetical protein
VNTRERKAARTALQKTIRIGNILGGLALLFMFTLIGVVWYDSLQRRQQICDTVERAIRENNEILIELSGAEEENPELAQAFRDRTTALFEECT